MTEGTEARVFALRRAGPDDVPALHALIAVSAGGLGTQDYSPEQISAALKGVFGVDSQLIADGTYFVAECGGRIVGCGGWSRRSSLFGSDTLAGRDQRPLDPRTQPARVRAFFVHPDYARRGIAHTLLERCEAEAAGAGFSAMELVATLTGVRFYAAEGYASGAPFDEPLGSGASMRLVPMRKALGSSPSGLT